MFKRMRGAEEEKANNITVAKILLQLSCGVRVKTRKISEYMRTGRAFECKTCGRRFASFQALGGHCTSHGRSRGGNVERALVRRRIHRCAVCGMGFGTGQALGGHMRRHKASDQSHDGSSVDYGERPSKLLLLDLNMPPPEDEGDLKLHVTDKLFSHSNAYLHRFYAY